MAVSVGDRAPGITQPRLLIDVMREVSMQIKFLNREGVPKAEIARCYGISRQTVCNQLKRSVGG